ncbi:SseB family protein, partial [Streptomyces sp. NPDC007076]|uniref:SseB family protein n=1 Tax=Streptomyces sp. NPDC007076 TaxID=3160975 RepID=UPI0033F96A88
MAQKNIPDPGYSDDDGTADPALTEALAAWAEDRGAVGPVLEALKGTRLLVPVVAVLGEVEEDENGLRREKTSDMAVPTLQAGGRRALPAFTSTASLALWDPQEMLADGLYERFGTPDTVLAQHTSPSPAGTLA